MKKKKTNQLKTEELTTDRLILRKLTQKTFDFLYRNLTEEEQMEFLGLESMAEWIQEKARYALGLSTYNKKFVTFQLIEKSSKTIIGWCGFHTWYIDHDRAEIGYGLPNEDQRGQGLMSEAFPVIIDYGFREMKLHRIEAFVGPDNIPSLKLVQKFNFIKEGCLKQHYFANDKYEDSLVFVLFNPNKK